MTVAKAGSAEYFRRLGAFDTTMIVIGGIIGADYVVFGDWLFFGLIVATIFGYRRRDAVRASESPSTYRAPGYPLLPAPPFAA